MTAPDYKTKLLGMRDSRHTPRAADCWIDMEIAELEQERETVQTQKNNRPARRSPLKPWLEYLYEYFNTNYTRREG